MRIVASASPLIFCAALALYGASASHAADYPARPLRVVVPYAAGGGSTDVLARYLAAERVKWGKVVRDTHVKPE